MTSTVEVPIWLLVLILGFAGIALLDRVLVPSVRWVLRRRIEQWVARLNSRLKRPIQPFRLLGRGDMIGRLVHDPRVMQAVVDHARETGVPETVAFAEARRYAGEIVPGFSALIYFGVATRLARWLSKAFYQVQVERVDEALAGVDPQATVVFVMNHRSNMDYVLVTWLVAGQSTISFAVGEWARVWPLSSLVRAMGAYFIRRGSRNTLYRRVLARYVQIAAGEGSTQAIFPEGNLSLDGRMGAAKLGLLAYLLAGAEEAGRDIVFVPVGIAYDRVLEDRVLTKADQQSDRGFAPRPLRVLGFMLRMLWRIVRRRFPGFGSAAVAFGAPLSLRDWVKDTETAAPEALATALMARIGASIPVLPVPLVAAALAEGPVDRAGLEARIDNLCDRLSKAGAVLKLPATDIAEHGLRPLVLRGIVAKENEMFRPHPPKLPLFRFYAASVQQWLENPTPVI